MPLCLSHQDEAYLEVELGGGIHPAAAAAANLQTALSDAARDTGDDDTPVGLPASIIIAAQLPPRDGSYEGGAMRRESEM